MATIDAPQIQGNYAEIAFGTTSRKTSKTSQCALSLHLMKFDVTLT